MGNRTSGKKWYLWDVLSNRAANRCTASGSWGNPQRLERLAQAHRTKSMWAAMANVTGVSWSNEVKVDNPTP